MCYLSYPPQFTSGPAISRLWSSGWHPGNCKLWPFDSLRKKAETQGYLKLQNQAHCKLVTPDPVCGSTASPRCCLEEPQRTRCGPGELSFSPHLTPSCAGPNSVFFLTFYRSSHNCQIYLQGSVFVWSKSEWWYRTPWRSAQLYKSNWFWVLSTRLSR
jgi:hypothetical protein